MVKPQPPLIQALLQAANDSLVNGGVELIETHGAWVLLAGDHVYKIKKPVQLPFMDFSTLALRRAACEAEIRVNQRFAPTDESLRIYRGALPITGAPDHPVLGGPAADAIEFAVHMRRFDDAFQLDHLCQRGGLQASHVQDLARRVAAFQASAEVAGEDSPWGLGQDVVALARDNLASLCQVPNEAAPPAQVQGLRAWTESTFERIAPLLQQRRRDGRVREGHGDLHLGNLVLLGDEVVPFDAIEFNDALRWIDVASDIAFTWMELLHRQQGGLANVLISEWLDASGDVAAPTVLPFFAVYRALVRAKVAAVRLGQTDVSTPAGRTAIRECRTYVDLAQALVTPGNPLLLITHGLSGSGKTWVSGQWLEQQGARRTIRLRSDVERKRLHGLSALQASGSGLHSGLYTAQAHGDTYASLLQRTRGLLAEGWTVVVDAAFLRQAERAAFAALAAEAGCPFHILACEAPVDTLRERIQRRQASGADASEATVAVLEQQLGWLEPLTPEERRQVWA